MFWEREEPIIQLFFKSLKLQGSSRFGPNGVNALDDRTEDHRYSMEPRLRIRIDNTAKRKSAQSVDAALKHEIV